MKASFLCCGVLPASDFTVILAKDAILSSSSPIPQQPIKWQALSSLMPRGIELIVIPAGSEGRVLTLLDDVCTEGRTRLMTLSQVTHTDKRVFSLKQVGD